jgi:hypothetical protein
MTGQKDYHRYYREVELHWSLGRGNQVIVSPLEFESISQWWDRNIPIQVVLRAIDRFLERRKKNPRKRQFLLNHVAGDVEKIFTEYQFLHQGAFNPESGDEPDSAGEDLTKKKLIKLSRSYKKQAPEYLSWVSDELAALADDERMAALVSFDELETLLNEIEAKVMLEITRHEDKEILDDLKNELLEFLDPEKDEAFLQKAYNDQLRTHFNVPRLTVLG